MVPINDRLVTSVESAQAANYEKIAATLFEHFHGLSSVIQWIKQQIGTPSLVRDEITSTLVGARSRRKVSAALEDSIAALAESDVPESRETLQEMQATLKSLNMRADTFRYYLAFVYLGHFLKNLL